MAIRVEDRPVNIIDYLIQQQIGNESAGVTPLSRDRLVQSLAVQMPHRLLYSPTGDILRAVFFSGDYPYEAYIEVLRHQEGNWKRLRGEHVSTGSFDDLERQIAWRKAQFGTEHDLLTQPDHIYRVHSSGVFDGNIVHVGIIPTRSVVSCTYILSPVGFRIISLDQGEGLPFAQSNLEELRQVPDEVIRHSQRSV